MGVIVDDIPFEANKVKAFSQAEYLYHYPLRNVPGFSIGAIRVVFPPGAATAPHTHGGASVSAVVTRGAVYNKMNNDPTLILKTGEHWYEAPGCHHRTSANVSETEEAEIMVTFVVETAKAETGLTALVVIDEEYREDLAKRFAELQQK